MLKKIVAGMLLAGVVSMLLCGCAKPAPAPAPTPPTAGGTAAAAPADVETRLKAVEDFVKLQNTAVNPSLSLIMEWILHRHEKLWSSGEAGAWDNAGFEVGESTEMFNNAALVKTSRADALKSYATKSLAPIGDAAKAKDKAAFETAYKASVDGCNACHAGSKSTNRPNGLAFIKIVVPTAPVDPGQDLTAK